MQEILSEAHQVMGCHRPVRFFTTVTTLAALS